MTENTPPSDKPMAQTTIGQAMQAVAPALHHAADRVNELASESMDAVRESSRQYRDQVQRASSRTLTHIRHHPVQSIAIAAAVGATAMTLLSLLRRRR